MPWKLWPLVLFVHAGCMQGVLSGGAVPSGGDDGAPPSAQDGPGPVTDAGPAPPGALSAPGDILGLFVNAGYRLSWTDTNDGEEHYLVERAPTAQGPFQQITRLDANVASYIDTGFPASGRPVYRVWAEAAGQPGPPATCDSGVKAWTYIRVVGYDALWGSKGPTMASLKEGHLQYDLEGVADRRNINLVLLGDAYGADGSIYAHVGEQGTTVVSKPEVNTGDPETYRQLFDWVVHNHPGQRYALSYWSHGSGSAVGLDDTSNDQLTTEEMAAVLDHLVSRAGRKVEVLFVCACLQQMVENGYALRESVRYMVAGESTVGCGCDVLSVLKDNLERGAGWLADANTACQITSAYKKDVVYSAVRTEKVAPLVTAIDELAAGLKSYVERGPAEAGKLRSLAGQVQHMGTGPGSQWAAHLDLVDLCQRLPDLADSQITQRAQNVLSQTTNVVTHFVVQNDEQGLYGKAHGLAIYHPTPNYPYYFPSYGAGAIARDTRWDEYLRALYP